MTCDQCPDVLLCWQGKLDRHACHYCGRVEVHHHPVDNERGWPIIVVRRCPPDAPVPDTHIRRGQQVICDYCRIERGYSVKRSCPSAREYHYEE